MGGGAGGARQLGHIAWVIGGGKLIGYVNGNPSPVMTTGPLGALGVFGVGRMFQNDTTITPSTVYPTQLQHVAVFKTTLSAARVQAQAKALGLYP